MAFEWEGTGVSGQNPMHVVNLGLSTCGKTQSMW